MSIETMTKLATVTVGSGGSATIDFNNIPQTYSDLVIKYSVRNDSANGTLLVRYNGDGTAANYTYRQVYSNGSAAVADSQSDLFFGTVPRSTYTASTFGNGEIYIPNYTSNNYKSITTDSVSENGATEAITSIWSSIWRSTAPITTIRLSLYTGGFVQYSTATLYGIKNARTTAGNAVKATGGNISFDGTYVVHTFTSSGTFTPTAVIPRADYLVVAGGGGGGGGNNTVGGARSGGGGGAGGLRCTVGATGGGGSLESALSLYPNTNYTVTIGAGGAGGATDTNGTSGSNSVFSTITSTGGGGGGRGGNGTNAGLSGGSGGGGGSSGTSPGAAGAASPSGQGYAGGAGAAVNGSGGGGGAGAVGQAGTTTTGGNGGNGVATSISGSSVTYGGGGGGTQSRAKGTGGNGGGGDGAIGFPSNTPATAGVVNTGGGGGAGCSNDDTGTLVASAAGGSGIVIIRYKA